MLSPDRIPANDLSRSPADVAAEIRQAIERVVSSGWYVMGPEHNALEGELADYLGVSESVLVGNGTDALELALAAVGVGVGSYVVTAANAGGYTSVASRALHAIPVYSDIEPDTLLMSAATVEAAIASSPRTPSAVVVTHLFGAMAPVESIVAVARRHGIPVIEDCAQSIGARSSGKQSGSFADIATTSFYPTKNLGALGDGGAVFTNDAALATSVRQMRQYGWESKYHIAHDGGRNSRMDEMQAAVIRVKLPRLDAWNDDRRAIHAKYESAAPGLMVNTVSPAFTAHLAVAAVDDREAALQLFSEAAIGTDIHYPVPDHQQKFATDPPVGISLPATERAAARIFSVPMFPALTVGEQDRVAETLARVANLHG